MPRILPILALCLVALCSSCPDSGVHGAGTTLAQPADSKELFGHVGAFQLVERSGRHVSQADLLGHPWAAAFVFTRCSGPCPKVTATMRALQDATTGSAARLVSFSVDPEFDTPKILRAYADGVGADPERWWFLTGAELTIDQLIRGSFWSPVERDAQAPVGQRVTHRTQIAAVDKWGNVRGFYSGETNEDVALIAARLAWLANEKEAPKPQ